MAVRKINWVSLGLILSLFSLVFIWACAVPAEPPPEIKVLKIGIIGPLSGPASMWGQAAAKVAPRFLGIAKILGERHEKQYGIPIQNYGIFATSVGMTAQYLEAVQQAGTIDPDKVMSTFRGGTFDTFLGTYKLSGEKTYGSPIVFGYPCAMGKIEGDKEISIGEYPLLDADYWTSKYAPRN